MSPKLMSQEEFDRRESELIATARELVENECLTTLTIDKLVAASTYSKGTIYKHFISKEDLLLAMCNTSMQELQQLFIRALGFNGKSRERIIAVMISYIIWAKLHPLQLFAVLSAHSPTVVSLASDARNLTHFERENSLMGLMSIEIKKAVAAGDLTLPADMSFEQVTFAMWSASWGAMALITSKGKSKKLSNMVLERETYTNTMLILDGFSMKPLSQNWDYSKSVKRILKELFQPEVEQLKANGTPFLLHHPRQI